MSHDSFYLDDYDYVLPAERIAQLPTEERGQSRLLVLEQGQEECGHRRFAELGALLRPGDLLVLNTTKVFPARLFGRRPSGGRVEIFLLVFPRLKEVGIKDVGTGGSRQGTLLAAQGIALLKSSKRPKPGEMLQVSNQLQVRVDTLEADGSAQVTLCFPAEPSLTAASLLLKLLDSHGQMPLPPYINRPQGSLAEDRHRYQTRYARHIGSVAAPTAGLHFSDELLAELGQQGVEIAEIILHVGYGTFAPVRTNDIREHRIHREQVEIDAAAAEKINRCKAAGGRIWAVGTTTARSLEFAADDQGQVQALQASCDLFIYPGFRFQVVDNLITNFHLPKSSLLFLVSALAGRERILAAYAEALAAGYRFFSYGDAMAIVVKP